ncbi:MAG: tRNA pseudouridine(55) synthase TruB, partial [Victivallaceae bacterium]|nr:tRNA pseudouridine(55) synthase TruB [Victivallaceae bacterium]
MRYDPKRHHLPVCDVSGILTVDKPSGWTSFDVVNFVRSRFNVPKVGHCGTLDPAATGLLVLVLGRFTAFSEKLSGDDKTYEATLRLGVETDSFDLDGAVVSEKGAADVSAEAAKAALLSFVGEQMQVPPMVSAVKVGGKKLYELARKGVEIAREPRPILISAIRIARVALPEIDFELDCSKGTYVRALCHDVGAKLGCGGVLAKLRRSRSGRFDLKDAVTVETMKTWDQEKLAE